MTIREIFVSLGYNVDRNSERDVENSINGVKNLAKKALGAIAVVFSVRGLSELAEAAAEAEALESQFTQVFGSVEKNASDSLQAVSDYAGAVTNRMKGSFTQIAAFTKTTGATEAEALAVAERGMKAVADSAAFYDRSLENVTDSLQSFLKGNFENDAALGLSCTETTRNTAANALYGKSFKDLSEYQKQLTLLQMVEDANKASGALGQAARESDTWTNQLGNLKQSLVDLKAAAGSTFLKPAVAVLKILSSLVQKATAGIKSLTSENGMLTKATERYHAIVKRLQPAIERLTSVLARGFQKGADIVNGFVKILGGIGNTLKLLATIAGAFFVVMNWSKIIGMAKSFMTLLSMIGKMFSLANLKILAVVAIIVVLALIVEDFINFLLGNDSIIGTIFDEAGIGADNARQAIMNAWNSIVNFLVGAWDFIKQAAGMCVDTVKGFFEKNSDSIRQNIERAWGIIKTFLNGTWTFISQLASTIFGDTEDSIDGSTTSTKDKLLAVWQAILDVLSTVWNALFQVGSAIFNAIATVIETVFGWIQVFWNAWGSTILSWFKALWENLGQFINGFLDVIKGLANFISSVFAGDWSGAWEAIKQVFSGIWEMITALLQQAWTTITSVISNAINLAYNTIVTVLTAISTFWNNIFNNIKNFVSTTFNNILTGITNVVGNIRSAIVNGLTAAIDWIKALPAQALQWGADIVTGIANGITGAIGAITDAVKGIAEKITSFLHFSVPDEGPLTEYESWMPDFMQGLAKGIEGNQGEVLDKVKGLASGISVLMQGATANAGTAAKSTISNQTSNITQNVDISNSYSGGSTETQKNVSKAMKKSAVDATTQMARALAYSRG